MFGLRGASGCEGDGMGDGAIKRSRRWSSGVGACKKWLWRCPQSPINTTFGLGGWDIVALVDLNRHIQDVTFSWSSAALTGELSTTSAATKA